MSMGTSEELEWAEQEIQELKAQVAQLEKDCLHWLNETVRLKVEMSAVSK